MTFNRPTIVFKSEGKMISKKRIHFANICVKQIVII